MSKLLPCDELKTVEYQYKPGGNEYWTNTTRHKLSECKARGWQTRKLVTRQNAEEVIAAKDARIAELENEIVKNGEDEDLEQWFFWRRKAKKAAQRCSNQKAQIAGMTKKVTKLEADNKRLREALADTLVTLEALVDTTKKEKEPYETPLSTYDRGVAVLAEAKP